MEKISFTVDAGIINRLGLELVAKSETAVAELIKNAYDADANLVTVKFKDAKKVGGTLYIDDDGLGMTKEQLINGFMRLATTDKLHHPISEKYERPKAGRKGIGRFATQRLGEKLTIITQVEEEESAWKLTINWNDYETGKEVSDIKNSLEPIKRTKDKAHGTILIIEKLRDIWSEADIKRVYRYVSELIQPNFLKISNYSIVEESKQEAFEVKFFSKSTNEDKWKPIADSQIMMLDRALAVISGYVDKMGYGYCTINSPKFGLFDKDCIPVSDSSKDREKIVSFDALIDSEIIFKAYYFIGGDRTIYYSNMTKPELNAIKEYLKKQGGVKLYRNGFRVTPYGSSGNDWLNISSKSRIGEGVPYSNNNLIGFVQITDREKNFFEEVAGREGIIEKEAFKSLQRFVSLALEKGFKTFVSALKMSSEYKQANKQSSEQVTTITVKNTVNQIQRALETLSLPGKSEEEKAKALETANKASKTLERQANTVAGELEMMRILAGVGLTIGEFIHEIKQFTPAFGGYLNFLLSKDIDREVNEKLIEMKTLFTSLQAYTGYFDAAISQNVVRELRPVDLRDVVRGFEKIAQPDLQRRRIVLKTEFNGWDLITCPMHLSEWNTVLQNLYSNAKKAIYRANPSQGKILIKCYKDEREVFLSFYDNGDGVPENHKIRIFDAFFTTSTPVSSNGNMSDEVTGTGLGLHILKQIIINRNGQIWVDEPVQEYNTCISIKLPLATNQQLKDYGY